MNTEQIKERLQQLPQYRGEVTSRNQAKQLPTGLKIGDIFWITNENKPQIVVEKGTKHLSFTDLDMNATVSTGITIYELNKSIISKEPVFDWSNIDEVTKLKDSLKNWLITINSKMILAYSRDVNYFTLFNITTEEPNVEEVINCLSECGELISMDFYDDRIEIWCRDDNDPAILMYMFAFDEAIVNI